MFIDHLPVNKLICRFTCLILALLCVNNSWAQDQGDSKAVWEYSKGSAVAARAPGLQVREAINGPDISQSRDEAESPSRVQQIYIDLINALFLGLNQVIPLLPDLLQQDDTPLGAGGLLITEIANDGTNTFVEVFNPNSFRVELADWAFCRAAGCTSQSELSFIALEGNDYIVFQLGGVSDPDIANVTLSIQVGTASDDIGLFDFVQRDSFEPTDVNSIVDYVKWGPSLQSIGIEDVAVSAGLWDPLSSVGDTLSGSSFQLRSDLLTTGGRADAYVQTTFENNSLGQPSPSSLTAKSQVAASTATAQGD